MSKKFKGILVDGRDSSFEGGTRACEVASGPLVVIFGDAKGGGDATLEAESANIGGDDASEDCKGGDCDSEEIKGVDGCKIGLFAGCSSSSLSYQ